MGPCEVCYPKVTSPLTHCLKGKRLQTEPAHEAGAVTSEGSLVAPEPLGPHLLWFPGLPQPPLVSLSAQLRQDREMQRARGPHFMQGHRALSKECSGGGKVQLWGGRAHLMSRSRCYRVQTRLQSRTLVLSSRAAGAVGEQIARTDQVWGRRGGALLDARVLTGHQEQEEQRPGSKFSRGPECPGADPGGLRGSQRGSDLYAVGRKF